MNHYDGPIRNTEQQLDHISYTLFSRCNAAAAPFTSHGYMRKNAKPKPFSSQTDINWIFFIEFYSADHIPSTAGDALRRTRYLPQATAKGRVLNFWKSAFRAKSRDHTNNG